jgi:phage tail tape-measure protein
VPIGLGVCYAWVRSAWPASTRRAGFAAAGAGALAGAWLGFSATPVPIALLTAVVGAIAGSNAALLLLDLRSGRSSGTPPATDGDVPARETSVPATIGIP